MHFAHDTAAVQDSLHSASKGLHFSGGSIRAAHSPAGVMGRGDEEERRRSDATADAGAGGEVSMSIEETNRSVAALALP